MIVCFSLAVMSGEYDQLQSIVIEPRGEHTHTLIVLHGLGDRGDSWASALQAFSAALVSILFDCCYAIFLLQEGFKTKKEVKCKTAAWHSNGVSDSTCATCDAEQRLSYDFLA